MSKTIGALWEAKKNQENSPIYFGNVEIIAGFVQQIAVFLNKKKTKDNQPDLNIVLSNPEKKKDSEEGIKTEFY